MILIHINPARVEKIVFDARSDMEEDFDWAAYLAIRPLIDQIDECLGESLMNSGAVVERAKTVRKDHHRNKHSATNHRLF
jgi:hypothetical protein